MIADERELSATRMQLSELESALIDLRDKVYSRSPDRYALLAESYANEIKRLRASIDEYLRIAVPEENASDLVVRILSDRFAEGVLSAQIVSRTLAALHKGWQRLGEYVARQQASISQGFLPTRIVLAKNFELDVAAFSPGSFKISLNASLDRPEVSPESVTAAMESLTKVIECVSEIDSNGQRFQEVIPELSFRLWILEAMKEVAPPSRGASYEIEFRGRFLRGHRASFGPETRAEILSTIRSTTQNASEVGIVREINLDTKTFTVRTQTTSLRCKFAPEMEERIKRALDRNVRVTGRAFIQLDGTITSLKVRDIEELGN